MAILTFGTEYTYAPDWSSSTKYEHPATGSISHEGCVVEMFSRTEQIMSDVWAQVYYAVVWDLELERPVRIWTHTEGEHGGFYRKANIDASKEINQAYLAWSEGESVGKVFADRLDQYDTEQMLMDSQRRQSCPKGRKVEVFKGRKVPVGTSGTVFWSGVDNFGRVKLGLFTSERRDSKGRYADVVWVAADNCRPVNHLDGFFQNPRYFG